MGTGDVKIILVGSSKSRLGKTQLCELLFSSFDGFSALKVTTAHTGEHHDCPRAIPCGACDSSLEGYLMVDDPAALAEKGKDTERYLRAGAEKVVWLTSSPEAMHEGLGRAIDRMMPFKVLVIEGNSPYSHLVRYGYEPLVIFICGDDGAIKESALEVLEHAQIVVPSGEECGARLSERQILHRPFSQEGRSAFLLEVGRWCAASPKKAEDVSE
jgi:hypothetical protein